VPAQASGCARARVPQQHVAQQIFSTLFERSFRVLKLLEPHAVHLHLDFPDQRDVHDAGACC